MPSPGLHAIHPVERFRALNHTQRNAFFASFLGWTLDAFDYFILVFCVTSIAHDFHTGIKQVLEALFWTLAMRPVGALLFGLIGERFGRRPALMLSIVGYSVLELASAFAHSLPQLLVLRALFGLAMGGEWGVGAALAFESLPKEGRGFFSGLLQEGYATGNLLAGLVYLVAFHAVGWRGMFIIGACPALLVLYIRSKVGESPEWERARETAVAAPHVALGERIRHAGTLVVQHMPRFLFMVLLMTAFTSFSHGTQDIYPTFLQHDYAFSPRIVALVSTVGSIGAICGGIIVGALSEVWGRRHAIATASLLAIAMIPLWAWSHTAVWAAVGGFLMQFMVQGAWGVVPAHLNELSPARALIPGLAYQIGNLLTSRNGVLQSVLAATYFGGRLGPVMAWTVASVGIVIAAVAWFGPDAQGADLHVS
jgi:SHS family lactate transporter-like MFS transporter